MTHTGRSNLGDSSSDVKQIRLAIVALALIPTFAFADEKLAPCWDGFEEYLGRYEELIRRSIPESAVLAVNVFPSFSGEWTVRVIERESQSIVSYVQFDESLWYSATSETGNTVAWEFSTAIVDFESHESPVTSAVVDSLEEEWARSISGAEKSASAGADGTTYMFILPNTSCGSAWSPSPGSRNDQLLKVVEVLRDIALSDSQIPDRAMESDIFDLLESMPNTQ